MPSSPRVLLPALVLLTTVTSLIGALGAPLVPEIAGEYGVSLDTAQWSLTTSLLVGAAATPVLGRLSATRHRNVVVLAGLGAVTLGAVLCAFPLGYPAFLAGRGMQGLGYGLTPVAIAIARTHLPEASRASGISLLSVTTVAGAGLGYPFASMAAEAWGVHMAFLAGAVLCGATLALCVSSLPANPSDEPARVDWVGTLLLSGGTTAALVGLAEATTASRPFLLVTFGLALASAVGWVLWVRRAPRPIVDLRLAVRPVPLLAHSTSFLIGVGAYLLLPLVTVLVQADWGLEHGPSAAGWLIAPYSLLSVAASRLGLRLATVIDRVLLLPLGCATYLLAFVWVTVAHDSLAQLVVGMLLAGTGSGLALAAIPALLVSSVPHAETGSSLGFNMVVRYLGFSLGSTLGVFVLTFGGPPDDAAFIRAMLVCCGAGVVMVAVSLLYAVRAMKVR